MSRIWGMMDVGKRSLMNSQTALQTVSHNVANKSTEGYSRQRVEVQSNVPVGNGKLRIGMGARASAVTRVNNPYLEKQVEKEGNELGFAQARSESLARVEQVYNEQVNKGLNKFMAEFFNGFRELSNNPEGLAARTLVKESADFLAKDFKRVHDQLTDIQKDIDFQIVNHVVEINGLTKEIADLNEKVQIVELNGAHANDERDRRDLLIKKLSEMVNIRYAEGDDGTVAITAGDNAVLVSGQSYREMFTSSTEGKPGKREGNIEVFYRPTESGTPVNVTRQFRSGKLGGLLDVRDKVANGLLDHMDNMAYTLASEVNKIHTQGFDRYNKKGEGFFVMPESVKDASQTLQVNHSILNDVGRIVAGASLNAPGDNRIANILSSLQYKPVFDGTNSFDNYYNSIVGEIGVEASRANSEHESQKNIVKQLENIRESISGVSLDEETAKMIEFQKNFDASARLIRTADEMMDTVLNLKRL
ncbi:MAG: flagellar hook-associated protein FlgK [Bdellovibrionaceae bacterium]|nr:flagellar hook-associated protein FlgK [Bdellovibrionales bacterium]MCB9084877.1 flagellar hook-associated protein FlgK [Pseudobdellovibrionaceae bacterium]